MTTPPKLLSSETIKYLIRDGNICFFHQKKEKIRSCVAVLLWQKKEDRIIFCSDGIVQSGLGTDSFPFGWEREQLIDFTLKEIKGNSLISAQELGEHNSKKSLSER